MSEEQEVSVEPYVVLYAIRYGLSRTSYARGDAYRLIRQHWPVLRVRWRDTLVTDLTFCTHPTAPAYADLVREARETLAWIEQHEAATP